MSAQTREVGEGRGGMLKGKEERTQRRDLEGRGGRSTGQVGMSKVAVIQKGLDIVT